MTAFPFPALWPRRIGVVGLGRMGSAFARNLLADGHELIVFDARAEARDALRSAGAAIAAGLADLAGCDLVVTSVGDDAALAALALDRGGLVDLLPAGAVHVSMSTVSPGLAERLESAHAARGQALVAAPVLGNPDLAARRQLFLIVAGAADAVERVRPVIAPLGQKLFPVGDRPASANLLKLAGNVLTALTLQGMGEVLALVAKSGIDPRVAFDLFTGSLFDGKVHKAYGGKILDRRYSPPGMTVPLAVKDIRLALAEGERLAVPMPAASLVHDRLVATVARGWADLDWSALGRLAAADAGVDQAA